MIGPSTSKAEVGENNRQSALTSLMLNQKECTGILALGLVR